MREAATLFSSDRRGDCNISINASFVSGSIPQRYWCKSVQAGGCGRRTYPVGREEDGLQPVSSTGVRSDAGAAGDGGGSEPRVERGACLPSGVTVSARRPTWREIGVRSRREVCRRDVCESCGGVAGGGGGSAAGRDLLWLLT